MTNHVPLGDSKNGGALFLLPREIRDEIYRLLVKGSYLDIGYFDQYSGKEVYAYTDVRPDFAILRISKRIGREATEILYSESVFRFVIMTDFDEKHISSLDPDRVKKLAPMMQNVILDISTFLLPHWRKVYEANMGVAIQNFGGMDIRRRSLLVRILSCYKFFAEAMGLPRICQQLTEFVGFRATTIEMLPAVFVLRWPPFNSPSPDDAKNGRKIRKLLTRTAEKVAKELEPVLGPAISGYKFDTGNVPIPDFCFTRLGDTTLIGYLEFHSNEHSVENKVAKEDQVQ